MYIIVFGFSHHGAELLGLHTGPTWLKGNFLGKQIPQIQVSQLLWIPLTMLFHVPSVLINLG